MLYEQICSSATTREFFPGGDNCHKVWQLAINFSETELSSVWHVDLLTNNSKYSCVNTSSFATFSQHRK